MIFRQLMRQAIASQINNIQKRIYVIYQFVVRSQLRKLRLYTICISIYGWRKNRVNGSLTALLLNGRTKWLYKLINDYSLLTIIDKYILKKFLGTYIFSISLILAIFIVFDIKDKVQTFSTEDIPTKEIVVDYYLMFIPVYGNMFTPLFTFISIIFFTSKMAHRTEFVAILSAGAGFNRILKPYLIGAFIIGFSSLLLSHFVIPKPKKLKLVSKIDGSIKDTVPTIRTFIK